MLTPLTHFVSSSGANAAPQATDAGRCDASVRGRRVQAPAPAPTALCLREARRRGRGPGTFQAGAGASRAAALLRAPLARAGGAEEAGEGGLLARPGEGRTPRRHAGGSRAGGAARRRSGAGVVTRNCRGGGLKGPGGERAEKPGQAEKLGGLLAVLLSSKKSYLKKP